MVKVVKRSSAANTWGKRGLLGLAVLGIYLIRLYQSQSLSIDDIAPLLSMNSTRKEDTSDSSSNKSPTTTTSAASSSSSDANDLKKWRKKMEEQCLSAKTAEEVMAISQANKDIFVMPTSTTTKQPRDDNAIKRCKRIVLDFGANIGDTSAHVIDSGMVQCERKDLNKAISRPVHFDVTTKQLVEVKGLNPVTRHMMKFMTEFGADTGPEDYCYYGVEGNHVFTEQLQDLEDYVMAIKPRPIQHMHFFTESVGAGQDGMTKLYLDTVNQKQNYWGSSLFANHQDVRKSANAVNGTTEQQAKDVMGYTIGTLLKKSFMAFDPNASDDDKKNNHLVLKVDIEGGEYPLLDEAAKDGTLCNFVKMGNRADVFIEFHSKRVTGGHNYDKNKFVRELQGCNVTFRNLEAWWA